MRFEIVYIALHVLENALVVQNAHRSEFRVLVVNLAALAVCDAKKSDSSSAERQEVRKMGRVLLEHAIHAVVHLSLRFMMIMNHCTSPSSTNFS